VRLLLGLVAFAVGPVLAPVADPHPTPPGPAAPPVGAIAVRAVGDRDPATGVVVAVPGARVGVVPDPGTVPGTGPRTVSDPGAVVGGCVTGADGTCTVTGLVPGPYRVVPLGDPPDAGLHRIVTVEHTGAGPVPYDVPVVVTDADPAAATVTYRRANPALPGACGLRVTVVLDRSGSIAPDEAAAMTTATLGFVDALAGTPTRLGVASFATAAPAAGASDLAPTVLDDPAGVAAVRAAILALARPDGTDRHTNWDAALRATVGRADLVVLLTDGNPTVHGVPAVYPPVVTGPEQVAAAVASANAVKAAGARIVAIGVGDPAQQSPTNLALVSGPVAGVDHTVTTVSGLTAVWRALAAAVCPPSPPPPPPGPPSPEPPPVPGPRFTG
jgi:hypothetical protein